MRVLSSVLGLTDLKVVGTEISTYQLECNTNSGMIAFPMKSGRIQKMYIALGW